MVLRDLCYAALIVMSTLLMPACNDRKTTNSAAENTSPEEPWWAKVKPVVVGGIDFYGKPCSVTKVSHEAGSSSEEIIFKAPSRLFTYCEKREPGKNYLKYDGSHIILHVERQTVGAGSRTGERYRSADLASWEEYIGVSWINGEQYEAWRKVGSTSSTADSRKKVVPEANQEPL